MGLDMYLTARQFIWSKDRKTIKITGVKSDVPKGFDVETIVCEAIYWRKSNAIHKWFVETCQEGKDDCGSYYVSHLKLKELLALVTKALDNRDKAEDILPTTSGFFFGGTDYDEWYWDDLVQTKKELTEVLKAFDDKHWEFQYHSSW